MYNDLKKLFMVRMNDIPSLVIEEDEDDDYSDDEQKQFDAFSDFILSLEEDENNVGIHNINDYINNSIVIELYEYLIENGYTDCITIKNFVYIPSFAYMFVENNKIVISMDILSSSYDVANFVMLVCKKYPMAIMTLSHYISKDSKVYWGNIAEEMSLLESEEDCEEEDDESQELMESFTKRVNF